MRHLRRDPFARATLFKAEPEKVECVMCGNRDGHGNSYVYFWEKDGVCGGINFNFRMPKRFCSVSCWESYNS
jgi:hypothetical protein